MKANCLGILVFFNEGKTFQWLSPGLLRTLKTYCLPVFCSTLFVLFCLLLLNFEAGIDPLESAPELLLAC